MPPPITPDGRRIVTLTRDLANSGPYGTFGIIETGTYSCKSLERPQSGGHPCIPEGEYNVTWTENVHPRHPSCYEVVNVPNRTAILIHSANVYEQLLGCIAPGRTIENIELDWEGQTIDHRGIAASAVALSDLIADMGRKNFLLIIKRK